MIGEKMKRWPKKIVPTAWTQTTNDSAHTRHTTSRAYHEALFPGGRVHRANAAVVDIVARRSSLVADGFVGVPTRRRRRDEKERDAPDDEKHTGRASDRPYSITSRPSDQGEAYLYRDFPNRENHYSTRTRTRTHKNDHQD